MKKTLTIYGMLFLFAFTFGLSFTLASNAQAAPCCFVICESNPPHYAWKGIVTAEGCKPIPQPYCDYTVYTCEVD